MELLRYRGVKEEDYERLRYLHLELFPVQYPDSFFRNVTSGNGHRGKPVLTRVAVDETDTIVGFVIAQMLLTSEVEDQNLFDGSFFPPPENICYIMTLGVAPEYARAGIASSLIGFVKETARGIPSCGAVKRRAVPFDFTLTHILIPLSLIYCTFRCTYMSSRTTKQP